MSVCVAGRERDGAGVVDADVDAAERLHRLVDGRLHLLLEADVAHERQRLAAGRLDLLGRRVDGAFELGVRLGRLGGDGDVGAVARRPQRDGEADAAAGAGDEQRLALERCHGVPSPASADRRLVQLVAARGDPPPAAGSGASSACAERGSAGTQRSRRHRRAPRRRQPAPPAHGVITHRDWRPGCRARSPAPSAAGTAAGTPARAPCAPPSSRRGRHTRLPPPAARCAATSARDTGTPNRPSTISSQVADLEVEGMPGMRRWSSSCCRSALRRLACRPAVTTLAGDVGDDAGEEVADRACCSGPPARSAAGLMSSAVRRPGGGGRDREARHWAPPSALRKSASAGVLHGLLEALHLHLLPQPVAPAGLARRGGGPQHDQVDVGLLRGLEQVGQQQALLGPARRLHVEHARRRRGP